MAQTTQVNDLEGKIGHGAPGMFGKVVLPVAAHVGTYVSLLDAVKAHYAKVEEAGELQLISGAAQEAPYVQNGIPLTPEVATTAISFLAAYVAHQVGDALKATKPMQALEHGFAKFIDFVESLDNSPNLRYHN